MKTTGALVFYYTPVKVYLQGILPLEKPRESEGFTEKELQHVRACRRHASSAIPGKTEAGKEKGFSRGVLSFILSLHEQRKDIILTPSAKVYPTHSRTHPRLSWKVSENM